MYVFAPFPAIAISVAKVPARLSMNLLYAMDRMYEPGGVFGPGIPSSPGGGGPGYSPTSTNPPPSLEEVGRMITAPQALAPGAYRWAEDPKGCPSGWHWSDKLNKCVRNRR